MYEWDFRAMWYHFITVNDERRCTYKNIKSTCVKQLTWWVRPAMRAFLGTVVCGAPWSSSVDMHASRHCELLCMLSGWLSYVSTTVEKSGLDCVWNSSPWSSGSWVLRAQRRASSFKIVWRGRTSESVFAIGQPARHVSFLGHLEGGSLFRN